MSGFQAMCYNKSFSELGKESGFTFNLYRGRVDWKKLEELDVDRIVRDQDVELLYIHLNSITNCNLESEYDVKILDPNFIKLFRLAQLVIDFLLHCKRYLEHCIKVAHESLQTSNKEVEILRKQLQARKTEVKQLKKKFKEVKQQLLLSPGTAGPTFECSLCGKVFMSETFLHGHHSRRHQPLPYSLVLRPFNMTPASPHVKIVPQEVETKVNKVEEITSIKKKYQEEIEDLKKLFFAEIEKLKQNDKVQKTKTDIQTQYSKEEDCQSESKQLQLKSRETTDDQRLPSHNDNHFIDKQDEMLPDKQTDLKIESRNSKQDKVDKGGEEEWVTKLEQREAVWRARLSDLDLQHKKQVQQLQDRLSFAQQQGEEMKKSLELRLEEVLAKFEQSQKLLQKSSDRSLNDDEQKKTSEENSKDQKDEKERAKQTLSTDKIDHKNRLKQPPPLQKRKAFVTQKTKTIQDSFEILENKDPPENLVQVLNPDDDSDFENVSTLTQNSPREKIDKSDMVERGIPPVIKVKEIPDEIVSRSRNKENIIVSLLEEERLRHKAEKKRDSEENEDSTFSESVTETESESGGEGAGRRRESQSSDDELLRAESNMAQQSLQSMEALLAANPGILQQLKSDLAGLVERRLQSLGIDPTWQGLPPATYKDKMAALVHQRNITAKSHLLYFTLRDKLRNDVETAVAARSKAVPSSSPADSLLNRLRSKAAKVIKAARFSRGLGSNKMEESLPKQNLSSMRNVKPLAASSPHLASQNAAVTFSTQVKNTPVITKVQPPVGDSFSLSSSTDGEVAEQVRGTLPGTKTSNKRNEDIVEHINVTSPLTKPTYKEEEDVAEPLSKNSLQTPGSYKSALRHTVSTSNLAKKKVLFVDEAFSDSKRSHSENTIVARQNPIASTRTFGNESIASLVQEIQQQLSSRSGKPSFSVDLMNPQDSIVKASEIPLTDILPLTKSGRDLLESHSKNPPRIQSAEESPTFPEVKSLRSSEPLSQILQRVPMSNSGPSNSQGKKTDFLEWSFKSQLKPPQLSPAASLSSIGSSLLDLSTSPRHPQRPLHGSLEWDLQDLEENLKG